jgi:hypothetical protein
LARTQDEFRLHVEDFSFTLGFSGYFFKHGDSSEIEGDEQLIGKLKSLLKNESALMFSGCFSLFMVPSHAGKFGDRLNDNLTIVEAQPCP